MSAQPWEKWYWRDWLTDPMLQRASPATRGIWVNLLGQMHCEKTYKLTLDVRQFCRLGNCEEAEMERFIEESRALGFCEVTVRFGVRFPLGITPDLTGDLTVLSRRRQREDKSRKNNALRQRRHYQTHKPNGQPNSNSDGEIPDPDPEEEKKEEEKRKKSKQKKEKRAQPSAAPVVPVGLDLESWEAYEKHRRENRYKVLKPDSITRLMRWLVKQPDQAAVVDQTIRNGWTGLFELKTNGSNGNGRDRHETSYERNQRKLQEWYERNKDRPVDSGEAGRILEFDASPVRKTVD